MVALLLDNYSVSVGMSIKDTSFCFCLVCSDFRMMLLDETGRVIKEASGGLINHNLR